MDMKITGFWSEDESSTYLPWPVAGSISCEEKAAVLAALRDAEYHEGYRGFSTCRLCGCLNGTTDHTVLGFVFPEGLRHYVLIHGVRPSQEFVDACLAAYGGRE